MDTRSEKTRRWIFILIPFFIATLVMLPRLISPQFGFLDDAPMLTQSEEFHRGNFIIENDQQAGRFRPMYWLYYAGIFGLAKHNPFWFFMGNLILFLILLLELRVVMKQMTFGEGQILFTSILFIFTMPIIENFYTLGKGEPLQLVFLMLAIILMGCIRNNANILRDILLGLASAIVILLATFVKETSLVFLPITILWCLYTLFSKDEKIRSYRKACLIIASSALVAFATYFILHQSFGATNLLGGTYTDRYQFNFTGLMQQFLRWMTLYGYYFSFLIPAGIALVVLLLTKKGIDPSESFRLFQWLSWLLGWFLILLPWQYAEVYYLLPFSIGVSLFLGISISPLLKASKKRVKWVTIPLIVLSFGLYFSLLPNFYTNARIQLAFDRANQEMLLFVRDAIPDKGKLYINIDQSNEYVENVARFLKSVYGREDISVNYVDTETLEGLSRSHGNLLVIPHITNQPRLTVRAGVEEEFTSLWNENVTNQVGDDLSLIREFETHFQLLNVNLLNLSCPGIGPIGFCEDPDPIIDTRPFIYAWEVYIIQ